MNPLDIEKPCEAMQTGEDSFVLQTQTRGLPVVLFSFVFSLFAASSTPAVNIQPDVAGGWDWHTKPGKGQPVIFVHKWPVANAWSFTQDEVDTWNIIVHCVVDYS